MARAVPATVVIVEREAAAHELIEQALRESGHYLLITRDPEEALRLGQRLLIDVLVGDAEAVRDASLQALRSLQPAMRLICVLDSDERSVVESECGLTLYRPFSLVELGNALVEALNPRRGHGVMRPHAFTCSPGRA
jgi:DNA-binding response OmpR family regulator